MGLQRAAAPADLHLHSACSDGTEAPAQVMVAAHEAGLRTVALTDHDTTIGWAEAGDAAASLGMTLLPGAEVSAKHHGQSVHVLAYLFDPAAPALGEMMQRVREDRIGRAERLVGNLARDYDIAWEDVLAQRAGDATLGRPHIADALVAKGIVPSREEAFASLLHPASGYYVGHYAPSPLDAVRAIVGAGGVAVIAHPAGRGMLPLAELERLIGAGLAGLEIDHRENTEAGKRELRRLAAAHDLIVTGSSDYHGAGKPNRPGENTTQPEMVERIIARASGIDPVYP